MVDCSLGAASTGSREAGTQRFSSIAIPISVHDSNKSVLKEVEDGELALRYDIGVGVGLDLNTELGQSLLKQYADDRTRGTIRALVSSLQSVSYRSHGGAVFTGRHWLIVRVYA